MPETITGLRHFWSRLLPSEKIQAMGLLGIKSRTTMNQYCDDPYKIPVGSILQLTEFLSEKLGRDIELQDLLQLQIADSERA